MPPEGSTTFNGSATIPTATGGTAALPPASRTGIASWVLFEWATQPFYTLILTFLFAPYFADVFVGNPVKGQAWWGYAAGFAAILVAIGSPVLGAIADAKGRRKPWMALFVLILAAAMASLWIAKPGAAPATVTLVLAAFIVATMMSEFALVFSNSIMPSLVTPQYLGRLSGISYAVGYAGGLIALIIVAAFIATDPATGKTMLGLKPLLALDAAQYESQRFVGPFCAAWLLLFVLPFFFFTPDRGTHHEGASVADGLANFRRTFKELGQHRDLTLFLIARMIFSDGLTAIFTFGGIYGANVFHWQAQELGLFGIVLALVGAIGAVIGGFIDDKVGSKRVIIVSLLIIMIGALGLLSVDKDHVLFSVLVPEKVAGSAVFSSAGEKVFLAFGMLFSLVVAPVQASSRSLMARLAPADKITQFFGLFAFSGKATAFAAPIAVALVTQAAGSQRIGMAIILLFLVLGLAIMSAVRAR